jgi:uncharacterized protein
LSGPSAAAENILIAGWSGRMLAAAARRAGYIPLVIDAFGDEDTLTLSGAHRRLGGAASRGFHAKPLLAALSSLSADAPTAPVGLVLGSGFEQLPRLVETLEERYPVLGCSADAVRRCKDPQHLYAVLARLGIQHPETRLTPPADPAGWLTRRIGGTGGTHIGPASTTAAPHCFHQRAARGIGISVSGVVSARGMALAFCRQWTSPIPEQPYRFGGIVGPVELDPVLEARLIDMVLPLVPALGLVGLVSFDFLVDGDDAVLLEVNPRPGASLDCLDDDNGSLFAAHIAAARGEPVSVSSTRRPGARAIAYLYADRGPLRVPRVAWPDHVVDRPTPATRVSRHRPVATVLADAATPDAARTLATERLETLTELLYQTKSLGSEPQ